MKILSRLAAAIAVVFLVASVHAQTVLQSGVGTPGHALMYAGVSTGQAVAADAGGASGGPAGTGLTELSLQVQGTGTPPFANAGTGPLGTNLCDYDGPTTNPGGYHFLCLSANAQGGGLIAYGAGGGAPQLPLFFNVNGVQFQPGSGGSGGGSVTSVFGRTGVVTAQSGDYSFSLLSGQAAITQLPNINGNTVLANTTNGLTVPSSAAVPSCTDSAGNHLNYTLGTGFSCGTTSSGGLNNIAANSVLANFTASSAVPVANTVPSCTDSAGNHLNYTNATGFSCGTTSSGGNVTSVFSRTGAVTAQSGDYSFSLLSGQAALSQLPTIGANTVIANATGSSATPTAVSVPGCIDISGNHLNYTNGTGFSCGNTASANGAVSITAGNAGIVVSPSPITGTGTVSTSFPSQTKTASYTFVLGDLAKFTWFNSSSALIGTIPQAIGSFGNGAALCTGNQGTGALTLSPQTSTIYGIPSLVLGQNQSVCLISDGANWGAQLSGNLIKLTDNGSVVQAGENMDLTSLAIVTEIPNNTGATGTTLNKLAKLTAAPSAAIIASTLDTNGMIGVVTGGAGTTGNAQIAITGQVACVFDAATTAGDYVQISSTVAGDCHDNGATFPTSGQVLGRVLSTNAATGTYAMVIFPPPGQGTGGGGGGGSVTSITVGAGLTSSLNCVSGTNTAITTTGTLCTDAAYVPFYFGGLTLSNDGVSPNTVIDLAAGAATSDDNSVIMKIAAVTKTTGAWAVGTGNGCLDTGSVAAATAYHVFLIERPDTQVVDVLCSTSANGPTLPTNYTKKRRLRTFFTCDTAICTASSTNIAAFTQVGNITYFGTAPLDVTTTTLGTSAALETLTHVPPGVKVQPICRVSFSNAASVAVLLTSPDETDVAPATSNPFTAAPGWDLEQPSTTAIGGNADCPFLSTNTLQQVRARASVASTSLDIVLRGWAE